jgi:hypothetical protein
MNLHNLHFFSLQGASTEAAFIEAASTEGVSTLVASTLVASTDFVVSIEEDTEYNSNDVGVPFYPIVNLDDQPQDAVPLHERFYCNMLRILLSKLFAWSLVLFIPSLIVDILSLNNEVFSDKWLFFMDIAVICAIYVCYGIKMIQPDLKTFNRVFCVIFKVLLLLKTSAYCISFGFYLWRKPSSFHDRGLFIALTVLEILFLYFGMAIGFISIIDNENIPRDRIIQPFFFEAT